MIDIGADVFHVTFHKPPHATSTSQSRVSRWRVTSLTSLPGIHTMKMSHSDSCLDVVRTSGACKMSQWLVFFSQHRELLFQVAVTCFHPVPLVCHGPFCNPHYMVSACVFLLAHLVLQPSLETSCFSLQVQIQFFIHRSARFSSIASPPLMRGCIDLKEDDEGVKIPSSPDWSLCISFLGLCRPPGSCFL